VAFDVQATSTAVENRMGSVMKVKSKIKAGCQHGVAE
jgi:hypothetical protein